MKTAPNSHSSITGYDQDAINSVVDGVEATARRYEDKWGVGRLELLVTDDLRERFRQQRDRFNNAVGIHDVVKVRVTGSAMNRAWAALDKAAADANEKPLDPEVWELAMPDGRVIAFCRHNWDAYATCRNDRYIEVWTPDEIVRLVDTYPEIVLSKQTFPGARVISIKAKPTTQIEPERDVYYMDELDEEERVQEP